MKRKKSTTTTLRLYAVRHRETKTPVGIFWMFSPNQLFSDIDGVCEPAACEYIEIVERGWLIWKDADWQMGEIDPGIDINHDGTGEILMRLAQVRFGLSFQDDNVLSNLVGGYARVTGWKPCHRACRGRPHGAIPASAKGRLSAQEN